MLKKRLGLEAIEVNWASINLSIKHFFKVPTTFVIPDGCEIVGNYAFYECVEMKKVIIPESVEEIGDFAFCGCWWLEEVVIPVSVEYIGDCAFEDCREATIILKKPESEFRYVGPWAFDGCRHVKEEIRG